MLTGPSQALHDPLLGPGNGEGVERSPGTTPSGILPRVSQALQGMTLQQKAGLTSFLAALGLDGGYVANSATQGNWDPTQPNWWTRGAGNNKRRLLRTHSGSL